MHAALIATGARPHVAADGASIMPFMATMTAIAFVVFGAARDRAVSVNDERARTRHVLRLRRG
jgi:hypothetical protein